MTTIHPRQLTPQALEGRTGVLGTVKAFLARRAAERQLLQMDERLLKDIGISRSEIGQMVWGS